MSWNFVIYKAANAGEQSKPLGDLDRVTDALNASFIALEWQSPVAAALPVEGGFRVKLTVQGRTVHDVSIEGGFNHLRELAGLCKREGWLMADAEGGGDVDLRDPQKWYNERTARPTTPRASGRHSPALHGKRPAGAIPRSRTSKWLIFLLLVIGLAALAYYLWYRRSQSG